MEEELLDNDWIAGTTEPSIADVALYSYVDRAPEGNIDLSSYRNVKAWLTRVEALPRFFPFRKTKAGLEAGI
jgi:glutathione S-transferase